MSTNERSEILEFCKMIELIYNYIYNIFKDRWMVESRNISWIKNYTFPLPIGYLRQNIRVMPVKPVKGDISFSFYHIFEINEY